MGIGWRISKDRQGRQYFHHSGVMSGARSHISVYPQQGLVVAFLSNARWTSAMDYNAEVLANTFLDNTIMPAQVDSERNNPIKTKQTFHCEQSKFSYKATFGLLKQSISGKLTFKKVGSQCQGMLSADNKMGQWLGPAKNQQYPIFFNGSHKQLSLVTPMGLYMAWMSDNQLTLAFSTGDLALTLTPQ
jgi:hypothetical protein